MDKKDVEKEKIELTKAIQQQETKTDDLRNERHKVQETFDNLQVDLRKGYQELTRLNQEEIHFGGKDTLITQQQEDEQSLYFRRQLGRLQEEISQQYNKQAKLIENETEHLQQKRSELVWD